MKPKTEGREIFMKMRKLLCVVISVCVAAASVGFCASAQTADAVITFSESGAAADTECDGITIVGSAVTVSAAGRYEFCGESADGSISVDKKLSGVTLVLSGLTLSSTTTAPIVCGKNSSVVIETALGTVNTLTDNEPTDYADAEGAVIKTKSGSTLTFGGAGELNAVGNNKNGIKGAATSEIIISSGTVKVNCQNNALASDGSVYVNGGTLDLTASGDGIKSEPDTTDTESKGTVTINGGNITIVAGGDGIQSTGALTINGGTLGITTAGGHTATISEDLSAKGIKSTTLVNITGGDITVDSADDAVHSNSTVFVTGGTLNIDTGDDGVHADSYLVVGSEKSDGPVINVNSSYEAIEAARIFMYSGSGYFTASDDGINAANSDLTGADNFSLAINGGEWHVNSGGDGIDSNGNVYMTAGTLEVFGSAQDNDAALDFDGKFYYSGGTLVGIGRTGMAQTPSSGTYVVFGSNRNQGGFGGFGGGPGGNGGGPGGNQGSSSSVSISQGDTIEIKDQSGNTVYSSEGKKGANSVVFSCDGMVSGASYSLYVNGSLAATASATSQSSSQAEQPTAPTQPTTTTTTTTTTATTTTTTTQPATTATTATTQSTTTTTATTTQSTTAAQYARGDINCDGNVNVLDLVIMKQLVSQPDLSGNEKYAVTADLNGDNRVNVVDLVAMKSIIAHQ